MTVVDDVRHGAKVSIWNDPKIRSVFFQVILIAVLGFLVIEIVLNTISNLQKLNKDLGFDFLSKSAGFDIIQTLIPYTTTSTYGRAFWVGLLNTLLVSVLGGH